MSGPESNISAVLARLGVREVEVLLAGSGKVDPAATVVRLTASQ